MSSFGYVVGETSLPLSGSLYLNPGPMAPSFKHSASASHREGILSWCYDSKKILWNQSILGLLSNCLGSPYITTALLSPRGQKFIIVPGVPQKSHLCVQARVREAVKKWHFLGIILKLVDSPPSVHFGMKMWLLAKKVRFLRPKMATTMVHKV